MRTTLLVTLLSLLVLLPSSAFAEAGIEAGDFRLGLSGGILDFVSSSSAVEGTATSDDTKFDIGFGPIGNPAFGWTLGIAFTRAFEMGLHFMVSHASGTTTPVGGNTVDTPSTTSVWGLGYIHYNARLSKTAYLVPEFLLGGMYVGSGVTAADGSTMETATGGVNIGLGLGLTYFLTHSSSLDLGVEYLYGALNTQTTPETDIIESSAHMFMIRMGISIWMGGGPPPPRAAGPSNPKPRPKPVAKPTKPRQPKPEPKPKQPKL